MFYRKILDKYYNELFFAAYSLIVIMIFYMLLSSRGPILGNDPAVHLSKAQEMLETGKVSVSEITWYPPLYRIILAELITLTGSESFGIMIFLAKIFTIIVDWLIVLSVYLLGLRLFGKECGIIASALTLLCFSFYEINFWGGYSDILSLLFFCMLLYYLPSGIDSSAHKWIVFLLTAAIVLTHQFTTFVTGVILIVYTMIMLLIFRKSSSFRLIIIAILGAIVAFVAWYLPVIMPYWDILISHVFFSQRQYLYLVGRVSLDVFMLNFGAILFLAFLGLTPSFIECRRKGTLDFFVLLCLSFLIPLAFTQVYMFGVLVPYDRFVYYLMIPCMVFAAAAFYVVLKGAVSGVSVGDKRLKFFLKLFSAMLVILMIGSLYVSRIPALPDKISEAVSYYSYLSAPFYQGALWLRGAYPGNATVVTTEKPGLLFGMASNKYAIMETDPTIERSTLAETVLNLAYELENPVTLYRAFEVPMPYELDQYNVLIHGVWKRASFLYADENMVSYTANNKNFTIRLSDLPRKISWDGDDNRTLRIQYISEDHFILCENVEMMEGKLPVKVNWTFTPLSHEFTNLLIHLSIHFDLNLLFNLTYVPGVFNWGNPWDKPTSHDLNYTWVLTGFDTQAMPGDSIAIYDPTNRIFFAIKFLDVPYYANIGALASKQIDALRLFYKFKNLAKPLSFTYLIVNLSEESVNPKKINLEDFRELFELIGDFTIQERNYISFMYDYNIRFLVFSRDQFRTELLNSRCISLIYSNKNCTICFFRSVSK